MFWAYFYENQEFMDWNEKNDIYRGVMDRKHFNFYQKKEDEICYKMMKKNLWGFHIWYEKKNY